MAMAMAMVVVAGSHQSSCLQSQALLKRAQLRPHPKPFVICTTACELKACSSTIASYYPRRGFRATSKSSWRRKCGIVGAGGEEIMEGDVVEYPLSEEIRKEGFYGDRVCFGLGAVSELVLDPSSSSSSLVCHVQPLVMNEPPKATWVVDERQDTVVVPLTQVRRLEAWLSMRMVNDRISNPHGEHAEHLWLVEEPLSESSGSPTYSEA